MTNNDNREEPNEIIVKNKEVQDIKTNNRNNNNVKSDDNRNTENSDNSSSNDDTKKVEFKALEHCLTLSDTSFATKIELTADYQGSRIIVVSDELYGPANNLIKTMTVNNNSEKKEILEIDNEEDGVQDGWLVKRHEPKAFVTIKLGAPGTVSGLDVDTTGYNQCAPMTVAIDGHLKDSPGQWTKILPEILVKPDSHNYFEVKTLNIYSHVHLSTTPGGGISRLRLFGDVVAPSIPFNKTVNLASTKLGSQVVQKPRNILPRNNLPNIILNRGDSSHDGWITPRDSKSNSQSEYTIIKLATEGLIDRIIIDTKHFIGNAPKSVIVEGCSIVDQTTNQNTFKNTYWADLINEPDATRHNIYPNTFHILPCIYQGPITHIRVRPVPDGGIQQILVKGRIHLRDENKMPIVHSEIASTSNKRKRKNDYDDNNENTKNKPTRESARLKARSTQSAA